MKPNNLKANLQEMSATQDGVYFTCTCSVVFSTGRPFVLVNIHCVFCIYSLSIVKPSEQQ